MLNDIRQMCVQTELRIQINEANVSYIYRQTGIYPNLRFPSINYVFRYQHEYRKCMEKIDF